MKAPDVATPQFFAVKTFSRKHSEKVLFYLTSYGTPWCVYIIPIVYFWLRGWRVIVYDFKKVVIKNHHPDVLIEAVQALVDDMHKRRNFYEKQGTTKFHGVGNSLGSYLLFGYTIRYPLDRVVLNSGGSVADMLFDATKGGFVQTVGKYKALGFDRLRLKEHWREIDGDHLGLHLKAKKVFLMWSTGDGVIPTESTKAFEKSMRESGSEIVTRVDRRGHIRSVYMNAYRLREMSKFFNL